MTIADEILEFFQDKEGISIVHRDKKFVLPRRQSAVDGTIFLADAKKIDKVWQNDDDFHVGPGGQGGSQNRYQDFKDYFALHDTVEVPEIDFAPKGSWGLDKDRISFTNGRHRFAVLRDMGWEKIPVAVPKSQLGTFQRRFS